MDEMRFSVFVAERKPIQFCNHTLLSTFTALIVIVGCIIPIQVVHVYMLGFVCSKILQIEYSHRYYTHYIPYGRITLHRPCVLNKCNLMFIWQTNNGNKVICCQQQHIHGHRHGTEHTMDIEHDESESPSLQDNQLEITSIKTEKHLVDSKFFESFVVDNGAK